MDVVPSLNPDSPRVRFGTEMRRLREAAELSQAAVAARLHERIVSQPGNPPWFRNWAEEIEPTLRVLRSWDPLLVPGLLQTEAYARHIFSHGPRIKPEEVDERVEARMRRQRILDREEPPLLLMLIDEGVLHRGLGGAEVMHEQLGHLLEMAQKPDVFVQVVDPECVAGLAGAFMIAELPDGQPDVVSSDSPAQAYITTDRDTVASIWHRYEALRMWAYPERLSLQKIEEARRGWT